MTIFFSTLLFAWFGAGLAVQCPHPDFIQKNICDDCHSWHQAAYFAKTADLKGMVTVLGPPLDSYPPLFRQVGPNESDYCVNRQPRAAYRCNMDSKIPYCFRLGTSCYIWHDPATGIPHKTLRLATVNCQDNFAWSRQHLLEDYDTDRSSGGPRYD